MRQRMTMALAVFVNLWACASMRAPTVSARASCPVCRACPRLPYIVTARGEREYAEGDEVAIGLPEWPSEREPEFHFFEGGRLSHRVLCVRSRRIDNGWACLTHLQPMEVYVIAVTLPDGPFYRGPIAIVSPHGGLPWMQMRSPDGSIYVFFFPHLPFLLPVRPPAESVSRGISL